ncbi:MAG: hypothetical protein Q9170_001469 [Blastenia crenularia]
MAGSTVSVENKSSEIAAASHKEEEDEGATMFDEDIFGTITSPQGSPPATSEDSSKSPREINEDVDWPRGLWSNDSMAESIGRLTYARERQERQAERLERARLDALEIHDQIAQRLAEMNEELRDTNDRVEENRVQELALIRSMKRKVGETSRWLDMEENKRLKTA